jgi:hypothetical protein
MSRPVHSADLRQLAIWLPREIKDELERRAKAEEKPEREVVAEALTAHLRAAVVAEKPAKKLGAS